MAPAMNLAQPTPPPPAALFCLSKTSLVHLPSPQSPPHHPPTMLSEQCFLLVSKRKFQPNVFSYQYVVYCCDS